LIFADDNFSCGNVDFERTNLAIKENLSDTDLVYVVTGFIAQSASGHYITLGRGGSDYTAAIIAAALGSQNLLIWTDVDGIFNADPRLIPDASVLDSVSFMEASELAYFGAKVIHPKTIRPAVERNIPVRILNTFNPEAEGTLIADLDDPSIKSVTHKRGISIINIHSTGMLNAHGFLARIFEVFARNNVVVDVVSTSEVSVSLTVEDFPENVVSQLSSFAEVSVYRDMAIVCLVGDGIAFSPGVLGRLFSSVNGFNVSMVSQGASRRNITFLISEERALDAVQNIFNEFFLTT